jgi:integrase
MTMLVSVFAAELASSLSFALFRSIELGLLLLAAGIASAVAWLKGRRRRLEGEAIERLHEARLLLDDANYALARDGASHILCSSCTPATRNAALHVLARATFCLGDPHGARLAIDCVRPPGAVDVHTLAVVENGIGRPDRAIAALDCARRGAGLSRESARLLIDLHAVTGDLDGAASVARDLARALGPADIRRVARALHGGGRPELATALIIAVLGSHPSEAGGIDEGGSMQAAALDEHAAR